MRYIQADSSMQHGKEFEAVYMMTVDCANLVPGFHNYNALIALRSSCDDADNEEVREDDRKLTGKLQDAIWDRHMLPLVSLAGGRGSLSSNFHAVCHTCFIEGGGCSPGSCMKASPAFCRECATFTGDMGVEFGLPMCRSKPCFRGFLTGIDNRSRAMRAMSGSMRQRSSRIWRLVVVFLLKSLACAT